MSVSYETYKNHPMIVLKKQEDDKYPFKFGLNKAKLVLDHIEEIRQFVESEGNAGEDSEI